MNIIEFPNIPGKILNVIDFGGIGDGNTLNTKAFNNAIRTCSEQGGGRVVIPPGLWITGPIELMNNIDLHLEKGALIVFTADHNEFQMIPFPDKNSKSYSCTPPIFGYNLKNISITGEGIFNGNGHTWRPVKKSKMTASEWKNLIASGGCLNEKGDMWWPSSQAMNAEKLLKSKYRNELTKEDYEKVKDFYRPNLLHMEKCENILLENFTLSNSPRFAMNLRRCNNIIIRDLKVNNEWWAQNGDGLDLSACKNVLMYGCTVNAGDDGICMKSSGKKEESPALKNIVITDCIVYRGHGGFVIGSNTDGGIENISVKNCSFIGTDVGLRFKSGIGRGGRVEKIYIDKIYMKDIQNEAILFDMNYSDAGEVKTNDKEKILSEIPEFGNIYINNVFCDGAEKAVSFGGLENVPVKDISISNSVITSKFGVIADYSENIEIKNFKIYNKIGNTFQLRQCKAFLFDKIEFSVSAGIFLKLIGEKSVDILIRNTDLSGLSNPFEVSEGALKNVIKTQ